MHVLRYTDEMERIASKESARTVVPKTDARRRLADLKLFVGCTAREMDTVDSLSTSVRVEAGRVLCREGTIGREFFVIVDGTVTVQVPGQPVHRLGAGEAFGEMALMDRGRRVATVTANEPTELMVFSVTEFASLLDQVPAVAQELLSTSLARRRMLDAPTQEEQRAH